MSGYAAYPPHYAQHAPPPMASSAPGMGSVPGSGGLPGAAVAGAGGVSAPQPPIDNIQPTVRVMRLYKPGFHITPTLPLMSGRNEYPRDDRKAESAEFTLSSHLILPDSFGDIYLGEKFSAYISIVNGFPNVPFYNVNLSVRLQTATATVDLADCRPSANPSSLSNILGYGESSEIIVGHPLSELGTHTLRVSVQYSLAYNAEIKTLRKFYRFNVLNPLLVLSSFMEINQLPMVQCQVTNSTKSPIFIEDMDFVSRNKDALFTQLHQFNNIERLGVELTGNDVILLNPDESFAFAFHCTFYDALVDKAVGYPVIKWCNSLGDSAVFRGEETVIKNSFVPTMLLPQPIKGLLLRAPGVAFVDDVVEVTIRLYNTSSMDLPVTLSCRNHTHLHNSSGVGGGDERSSLHVPAVAFNPSFDDAHRGLIFTGLTSQYLGILESDGTIDVHINLYATSSGLHELPPITVINNNNKEKYNISGLTKLLVQERELSDDDQGDDAEEQAEAEVAHDPVRHLEDRLIEEEAALVEETELEVVALDCRTGNETTAIEQVDLVVEALSGDVAVPVASEDEEGARAEESELIEAV